MLFFFHLFAGIVLGLLIADLIHDRRFIFPFIIGAVLPDLIDKPAGYILFADLFGSGRIFLHSIVIVGMLLILGFVFWRFWGHPEVLAVAFGMFLHQILDLMWFSPEDWFFPFLGFSSTNRGADYALTIVLNDFRTGSEWMYAVLICCAIILVLLFRYQGIITRHRKFFAGLMAAGALVFVILGGITIGILFSSPGRRLFRAIRFLGWDNSFEFIIGGIVFLVTALLLWRMRSHILEGTKIGEESP